jgi:endonuclease YncB( thermonuclease family)
MSTAYRLLGAAVLAMALAGAGAQARDLEGKVVAVHDGDTVTLLDGSRQQHRIRIAGIDAPEKAQAYGEVSKQGLAHLAFGKQAEVRCNKRDRYGREVCGLFVGARDVGLEQVRNGHAWWYRDYAREQSPEDRRVYEAAEAEARGLRRGLWRDTAPTAPWDWRRQSRSAEQASGRAAGRT